jgi:hypothetical protein
MARIPKEKNDPTKEALAAIEEAIGRFETKHLQKNSRDNLDAHLVLPGLENIRAKVLKSGRLLPIMHQLRDTWFKEWSQLLLLQIALVAGWFYHRGTVDTAGSFGVWTAIFSLCGAAALGFGGATLIYSSFGYSRSSKIRRKYDDLTERADRLVLLASELNKKFDVR